MEEKHATKYEIKFTIMADSLTVQLQKVASRKEQRLNYLITWAQDFVEIYSWRYS